eukprot:9503104-Karenia_brevis.AAC.1
MMTDDDDDDDDDDCDDDDHHHDHDDYDDHHHDHIIRVGPLLASHKRQESILYCHLEYPWNPLAPSWALLCLQFGPATLCYRCTTIYTEKDTS